MSQESPSQGSPDVARAWLIQTTEILPFIYDPLVHSREYVLAYLDETGASPEERENVLRQADDLEARARALE
jgi:hypothetical protein